MELIEIPELFEAKKIDTGFPALDRYWKESLIPDKYIDLINKLLSKSSFKANDGYYYTELTDNTGLFSVINIRKLEYPNINYLSYNPTENYITIDFINKAYDIMQESNCLIKLPYTVYEWQSDAIDTFKLKIKLDELSSLN